MKTFWLTGSLNASRMIAAVIHANRYRTGENATMIHRIYWYIRDERKAEGL